MMDSSKKSIYREELSRICTLLWKYIGTDSSLEKRLSQPNSSPHVPRLSQSPKAQPNSPPSNHTAPTAVYHRTQLQSISNELESQKKPQATSDPDNKRAESKEAFPSVSETQKPLQDNFQSKKKSISTSPLPDQAVEDEESIVHGKGNDLLFYQQKQIEKIFPRPFQAAVKSDYYAPAAIQKIASESHRALSQSVLYPSACTTTCPLRWQVISLLHPSSAPSELSPFLNSIIQAIRSKLRVSIGEPRHFDEIKGDPIQELSLADTSITIFAGDLRHMSSLVNYLNDLDYFTSSSRTGYTPCVYLGRYFSTDILYLPLDKDSPNNKPVKQELWRLLKTLSQ